MCETLERILPGKLPPELLQGLLAKYTSPDPQVILGPGIGRDATVIRVGDELLVAKTDPITFASDEIGWYAVHVNANDVACLGAAPRWFLATLLLPERATQRELVERVFHQMQRACCEVGAVLCGGHTEVTLGLRRPIVVGTMLGEVSQAGLIRPEGARPGQVLLLTKGIAIEGTSVLAREHPGLEKLVGRETLELCARLLHEPGISVVKEALAAVRAGGVGAMHDPTEGGLAAALWEMAQAAKVGLLVRMDRVGVLAETRMVCRALGLDPMRLLASGALLLSVEKEAILKVKEAISAEGVMAWEIGEVVDSPGEVLLREDGQDRPLSPPERDEVARALEVL